MERVKKIILTFRCRITSDNIAGWNLGGETFGKHINIMLKWKPHFRCLHSGNDIRHWSGVPEKVQRQR